MLSKYHQRGDTIIEVLLAITVFSLVAVIVITVMNQATNAAQRALEITLVRQQIDAQTEALRAAQQAYTRMVKQDDKDNSVWAGLIDGVTTTPHSVSTADGCPTNTDLAGSDAVIMSPEDASLLSNVKSINEAGAPIYAQVAGGTAYGLWIERTKRQAASSSIPDAYDFRIRACWQGAGTGTTPMEIETITRLYDVDLG